MLETAGARGSQARHESESKRSPDARTAETCRFVPLHLHHKMTETAAKHPSMTRSRELCFSVEKRGHFIPCHAVIKSVQKLFYRVTVTYALCCIGITIEPSEVESEIAAYLNVELRAGWWMWKHQ